MSTDDDSSDAQVRATYMALRLIESPAQALDARIRAAAVAATAVPRAEEKLRQPGTGPAGKAPSRPTPPGPQQAGSEEQAGREEHAAPEAHAGRNGGGVAWRPTRLNYLAWGGAMAAGLALLAVVLPMTRPQAPGGAGMSPSTVQTSSGPPRQQAGSGAQPRAFPPADRQTPALHTRVQAPSPAVKAPLGDHQDVMLDAQPRAREPVASTASTAVAHRPGEADAWARVRREAHESSPTRAAVDPASPVTSSVDATRPVAAAAVAAKAEATAEAAAPGQPSSADSGHLLDRQSASRAPPPVVTAAHGSLKAASPLLGAEQPGRSSEVRPEDAAGARVARTNEVDAALVDLRRLYRTRDAALLARLREFVVLHPDYPLSNTDPELAALLDR